MNWASIGFLAFVVFVVLYTVIRGGDFAYVLMTVLLISSACFGVYARRDSAVVARSVACPAGHASEVRGRKESASAQ